MTFATAMARPDDPSEPWDTLLTVRDLRRAGIAFATYVDAVGADLRVTTDDDIPVCGCSLCHPDPSIRAQIVTLALARRRGGA